MEIIKEWYGLFLAFAGAFAWLFRVESRGLTNEREIKRLWEQRKEDLQSAKDSREETAEMLTEIRGDIKKLLERREP